MSRVIVLNADYTFLHYTTVRRAHALVNLHKKATAASEKVEYILIKTINTVYKIPKVIRLITYIRRMYRNKVACIKGNVFIRDRYKCCYCGKTLSKDKCTAEHIIPKDQGGQFTWDNIVTACEKCNFNKGNKTPKQARMKMLYRPYQPTIMEFLKIRLELEGIQNLIGDILKN